MNHLVRVLPETHLIEASSAGSLVFFSSSCRYHRLSSNHQLLSRQLCPISASISPSAIWLHSDIMSTASYSSSNPFFTSIKTFFCVPIAVFIVSMTLMLFYNCSSSHHLSPDIYFLGQCRFLHPPHTTWSEHEVAVYSQRRRNACRFVSGNKKRIAKNSGQLAALAAHKMIYLFRIR